MSDEPQQLLGPLSQSILRDFWKDRAGNWSMENIQKFIVGMSKPPWWRWIARWKWRKLKRNMAKPQDGLSGWKVIDCRNAPGRLSDVVYDPAGGKTLEVGKRMAANAGRAAEFKEWMSK